MKYKNLKQGDVLLSLSTNSAWMVLGRVDDENYWFHLNTGTTLCSPASDQKVQDYLVIRGGEELA